MSARTAWIDTSIAICAGGVLPYVLYRVARWARKRKKGAYALGAGLLLFGLGNVTDPENRIVQEAKQLKKREEDDAGDPPNE
jgi:hypothetical protein